MGLFQKRFQPCGGFYLEGALKWLIPGNVVLLMLFVGLAMLAFDVYSLWDRWMEERASNIKDFYVRLGLWTGYVVHVIIAMPMDFYLHRATKTVWKNIPRLKIWTLVNFFNTIWATVDYWAHTSYFGFHFPTLTPYNFYCIYRFYMCIVIYYFCLDIEDEREIQAAARYLTDRELEEFEEGLECRNEVDKETKGLIEKVQYERYKRDQFEISVDLLEIDHESPLGRGAYGVVYRALYKSPNPGEEPVVVAVKTFEPGLMDAVCFKALLSELKVMTCMGQHENIVNLIGAVTSGIKMRSLQMVLEFCPYGSVLEFLRASRGLFVNLVIDGVITPVTQKIGFQVGEHLSTIDLLKWSFEISNGMAYLEEKKVVHGDLAARNLLLTEGKQIKIGDFGLARQLYQYSVYVKRQNIPLPWRWLGFECLTDMHFSTKSDVWSFSIVLHELFTLGEIPYQGRQFSLEFIESLRNGMRLERTPFCPDIIFKIMEQCWLESPELRPTFHDLQANLQMLMEQLKD